MRKLQQKGLVVRTDDPNDRRRKVIALTAGGERMLERLSDPARRARETALSAFSEADAAAFLAFLERIVQRFNDETRAPILRAPESDGGKG